MMSRDGGRSTTVLPLGVKCLIAVSYDGRCLAFETAAAGYHHFKWRHRCRFAKFLTGYIFSKNRKNKYYRLCVHDTPVPPASERAQRQRLLVQLRPAMTLAADFFFLVTTVNVFAMYHLGKVGARRMASDRLCYVLCQVLAKLFFYYEFTMLWLPREIIFPARNIETGRTKKYAPFDERWAPMRV